MERAEESCVSSLAARPGKAASRITAEGVVTSVVAGTTGAMVEVNCETDFRLEERVVPRLLQGLCAVGGRARPADVAALSALPYAQDGFGPTLEDVRKGLIGKIGENMSIRRFERYSGGGKLASYLHGTRIGVVRRVRR